MFEQGVFEVSISKRALVMVRCVHRVYYNCVSMHIGTAANDHTLSFPQDVVVGAAELVKTALVVLVRIKQGREQHVERFNLRDFPRSGRFPRWVSTTQSWGIKSRSGVRKR